MLYTIKMNINIIVAADLNNGIGANNALLCHLPNDLKYFKKITNGFPILMGRNTYLSIGKPLPNRINIVISRQVNAIDGCMVFNSIEAGIAYAKKMQMPELFIIGGDSIYKQTLCLADTVYLTRIKHVFAADAFFPKLNSKQWRLHSSECFDADEKHAYGYCFEVYKKIKQKV